MLQRYGRDVRYLWRWKRACVEHSFSSLPFQEEVMTIPTPSSAASSAWPTLPYAAWQDTYATLHLWTQIVGKIRLLQMPWINHSWQVTLYPTARGLTTLPMPKDHRAIQLDFDFIAHRLVISSSDGAERLNALQPNTVTEFYG